MMYRVVRFKNTDLDNDAFCSFQGAVEAAGWAGSRAYWFKEDLHSHVTAWDVFRDVDNWYMGVIKLDPKAVFQPLPVRRQSIWFKSAEPHRTWLDQRPPRRANERYV